MYLEIPSYTSLLTLAGTEAVVGVAARRQTRPSHVTHGCEPVSEERLQGKDSWS